MISMTTYHLAVMILTVFIMSVLWKLIPERVNKLTFILIGVSYCLLLPFIIFFIGVYIQDMLFHNLNDKTIGVEYLLYTYIALFVWWFLKGR